MNRAEIARVAAGADATRSRMAVRSSRTAVAILATFVVSVAVFLVAFVAAVRLVDARGEFGTGMFPVATLDGRTQKLELFRAYAAAGAVQGLILGSSRSWTLDPAILENASGQRFFNFSVGNARVEDYVAIYRWVRRQGTRPATLVIGLDVEALHDDDQRESTLEFNDELRSALDDPWASSRPASLWRSVIRHKRALGILQVRDQLTAVGIATGLIKAAVPRRYEPDGHLPSVRRDAGERAVASPARLTHCATDYLGRIAGMSAPSARRRAALARLLDEARADGVVVKLWLTPVDPAALSYIEARSRYRELLEGVRAYLRSLHGRALVEFYDLTDPAAFGGNPATWDDCFHIDGDNAALVAATVLRRRS